MGTRAMISIDGKPFIATHWDGYPESLGKDLASLADPRMVDKLIAVGQSHSIDFADTSVQKELNALRIKLIALKQKLPIAKVKKGIRRGNVLTSDDYEISPIKNYDDWAEYQYDIDSKTGKIKVREISGSWQSRKKEGKWQPLSQAIEKAEKRLKKII